jgi:hypothetical protein
VRFALLGVVLGEHRGDGSLDEIDRSVSPRR